MGVPTHSFHNTPNKKLESDYGLDSDAFEFAAVSIHFAASLGGRSVSLQKFRRYLGRYTLTDT
jgi:hypothetical protein